MIDYLKGVVAEATPTYAVIECCGVGYEVNITLMDYPLISGNQECKLYVHESRGRTRPVRIPKKKNKRIVQTPHRSERSGSQHRKTYSFIPYR